MDHQHVQPGGPGMYVFVDCPVCGVTAADLVLGCLACLRNALLVYSVHAASQHPAEFASVHAQADELRAQFRERAHN